MIDVGMFQIKKTFYKDFSNVLIGLWRGQFQPYEMLWVVPALQIRKTIHDYSKTGQHPF